MMSSLQSSVTTPSITSSIVSRSTRPLNDTMDDILDCTRANNQYSVLGNQSNQSSTLIDLTVGTNSQDSTCTDASKFFINKNSLANDYKMPQMVSIPTK